MASELSKFIEDELLREGNTGERSRLINGGAFSVEKPKQRPTRFGLCTKRNIACFIILGIVVGAVGTAVYHKDKATEKIQGWARSKGGIPPSTTDQGAPPAEGNATPPADAVPDAAANPPPPDAPPAEPAAPADGEAEAKPPPADPAPEGATPDTNNPPEEPAPDSGAQPPPEDAAGGRRMLRMKHF